MGSEHTPTPWELRPITSRFRHGKEVLGIFGPSEIVCNLDGIAVPDRMNDRLFVEDAANMRFIVRAVNSHKALVKALERIRDGRPSVSNSSTAHEQWTFANAIAACALDEISRAKGDAS